LGVQQKRQGPSNSWSISPDGGALESPPTTGTTRLGVARRAAVAYSTSDRRGAGVQWRRTWLAESVVASLVSEQGREFVGSGNQRWRFISLGTKTGGQAGSTRLSGFPTKPDARLFPR
jgi:hypothetical protein